MQNKNPTHMATRQRGATEAIEKLGGPTMAAERLSSITGMDISKQRVMMWRRHGIAPPWHPLIHELTKIPLPQLDPEIYPTYLFK